MTTTTTVSTGVSHMEGLKDSGTASFTCISCHVAFYTAENQREHYRSDWHRYNLKRKVADLAPLPQEAFAARLAQQSEAKIKDEKKKEFSATCAACAKTYASENAYRTHIASQKHKDAKKLWDELKAASGKVATDTEEPIEHDQDDDAKSVASSKPSIARPAIPWRVQLAQAKTESELNKVLDAKIASSVRLNPDHDCLFCNNKEADIDSNVAHMALRHSFFIPDLEYLTDLRGLLSYLSDKISVGNICLFCNGKGRQMHSLEAVRAHMAELGHCKLPTDGEDEISDYYDFSSTWEGGEWEDVEGAADGEEGEDGSEEFTEPVATISADGMALTIPNGTKILSRHHRPTPTPKATPNSLAVTRVASRYDAMGVQALRTQLGLRAAQREAQRENRVVNRTYQDFRFRVGIRGNKSTMNQHYRSQIGFD